MRSGSLSHSWRSLSVPVRLAAVLGLTLLLSACSMGDQRSSGFAYTGSWRGSLTDEVNGAGSFRATFQQQGQSVGGTWLVVMGNDPARQAGGSLSGEVFVGADRDLLEMTLTPAVAGECAYRLTLQRRDDSLTGEYAPTSSDMTCRELGRGTLQLSKQL